METAELEYRLLKDRCYLVVDELVKCTSPENSVPAMETIEGRFPLLRTANDLRHKYLFTTADYLSVIDYLASDV